MGYLNFQLMIEYFIFVKIKLHNMNKFFRCFLAILFVCEGCAMVDFPEKESRLKPSESEMLFSAEFLSGADSVATISVISNRSWYAHLNDLDAPLDPADSTVSVNWGQLDVCGHSNIEHKTDTVKVKLTVFRNQTQIPVNGVVDFYSEGEKKTSIKISQLPAVYHLNAVADREIVACKTDSVKIAVDCNTNWTAEILESTAEVSLSKTTGYDPEDIYLKFGENIDVATVKTAKVVFSAKDCPDKIIEFTQSKAEPYIEWNEAMTGKLNAWEPTGSLVFKTNCAWSVEVEEGTLSNIVFDKTSGEAGVKGDQTLSFSFVNTLTDPKTAATAKITLKTDYTDPITITVSQRPQLVINLAKNDFTPALPGASAAEETSHSFVYSGDNYSISIFLMRFITNKLYFVSGNDSGSGYIKFPVIPGATLRGVEIFIKGQSTYYKMTAAMFGEDGTQMSDQYSFALAAQSATHNFILGENGSIPMADTQYKLMGLAKQTCCINKIVLSYE